MTSCLNHVQTKNVNKKYLDIIKSTHLLRCLASTGGHNLTTKVSTVGSRISTSGLRLYVTFTTINFCIKPPGGGLFFPNTIEPGGGLNREGGLF